MRCAQQGAAVRGFGRRQDCRKLLRVNFFYPNSPPVIGAGCIMILFLIVAHRDGWPDGRAEGRAFTRLPRRLTAPFAGVGQPTVFNRII